jgi:hypothetical protein
MSAERTDPLKDASLDKSVSTLRKRILARPMGSEPECGMPSGVSMFGRFTILVWDGEYSRVSRAHFLLKRADKPPMDPRAQELLLEIYEPEIYELERIVGRKMPELRRTWPVEENQVRRC